MRKSFYITILIVIGLSSCTSQKKLQKRPPFTVEEPTVYKSTNSLEKKGPVVIVKIPIHQIRDENIAIQHLYFRGKIAEVTSEVIAGSRYIIGNFTPESLQKPDIIMHADPKKEIGNQAPTLQGSKNMEFPFVLADDEAVVSYIENDGKKVKYTKVSGIKEK